ncbi:hypothetical protein [Shewanella woodyi]|uniref:hypothetical protein n=1 Tax=Shewanella woodyi TaxID=60961 RepID=UPI003748CA19
MADIVTVALPNLFAKGLKVIVRLAPLPLRAIRLFGSSELLDVERPKLIELTEVSTSLIVKLMV